jgi:Tol biopolymer transport system component
VDWLTSELLWIPNRNEIFYTTQTIEPGGQMRFAIKGLDTVSGNWRIIDGGNSRSYHSLALSADAQSVYYVVSPASGPKSIYRVAAVGGSPEYQVDGVGGTLAVSPDGVHLAYMAGDSVLLFDMVTKSRSSVAQGAPVAFSPDGTQLLVAAPCAPFETCSYFALALGSGVTQPVSLGLGSSEVLSAIRWDPDGVRILFEAGSYPTHRFYIRNVTTGTTTEIPCEFDSSLRYSAALSPDGHRVAYWLRTGPSTSTLRLAGAQETVALGAPAFGVGGRIAFAPDGRSVAYITDTQLSVSSLP